MSKKIKYIMYKIKNATLLLCILLFATFLIYFCHSKTGIYVIMGFMKCLLYYMSSHKEI